MASLFDVRADHDVPTVSEFDGVVDKVQQHLTQPCHVAQHPLRYICIDICQQFKAFVARPLCGHVAGFFNRRLQVDRLVFQLKFA